MARRMIRQRIGDTSKNLWHYPASTHKAAGRQAVLETLCGLSLPGGFERAEPHQATGLVCGRCQQLEITRITRQRVERVANQQLEE